MFLVTPPSLLRRGLESLTYLMSVIAKERSDVAISFPKLIRQRRLFHLFSRKKVSKKRRGDKF